MRPPEGGGGTGLTARHAPISNDRRRDSAGSPDKGTMWDLLPGKPVWFADTSSATCIICVFAQNRALARKVSDEFTVPLRRGHHRIVSDETAWWQKIGLDRPQRRGRCGLKRMRSARTNRPLLPQRIRGGRGQVQTVSGRRIWKPTGRKSQLYGLGFTSS
jgi:hypothetical protein